MAEEKNQVKISIHRLFIHAGRCFIRHIAEKISICRPINRAKLTLQTQKPRRKYPQSLLTAGKAYNLQEIYQRINEQYFSQEVDLKITWFGNAERKAKYHRTLGYYDGENQLIKIHKILDNAFFPSYYLDFIVYHEMLHHVYPPYYAKNGRYLTHHKAFKEQEKKFRHYQLAANWEKKNLDAFFTK